MEHATNNGRTCLIAGCGDVGTRVGLRLAARGWRVIGLRRSGTLPAPIEAFRADLGDPASLAGLASLAPAALVHVPTPDERTPAGYRRVYLEGLAHVLGALRAPPSRVVWVGSTAVHGTSGAAWQDEDTPPAPEAWNGVALLDAERWIRANVPGAIVLRLAGLYGPGRDSMIRRARAGEKCRASPPHWTNRIHVDDAAAAIVHLLELDRPASLYLGVDEEPATECTVLRHLAMRLGMPTAAYVDDPRATSATGKRLSSARLRASGFRFAYPTFREGYALLLALGA